MYSSVFAPKRELLLTAFVCVLNAARYAEIYIAFAIPHYLLLHQIAQRNISKISLHYVH